MDAFHALEARLRERVGVLFDCARPDAKSLSDAEVWLREFSKSEEAWVVVVRVLERPDANATEAMFCARTLHDLLRRCVSKSEKTQASHAAFTEHEWSSLRERLFALTKRYAAASGDSLDARGTVTQLSLCVAALCCKMPAWNAESVVQDVIEAFASDASVSNEAKMLCMCSFLAVVPQEAQSRELSIHPMRREQVVGGMKNAANAVMDLLQQLVTAAGGDSMIQKYVLDALEAWADLADVTRAFPRLVVEGALHIVAAAEAYPSSMKQSAAGAARASLEQCVWTKDANLRDLLAAGLTKLRGEVVLTEKADETRVLIAEILSAVAMRALRDQKDATKNPLATGPDAAGDRSYVKYAEFKRLQREQKRNAQQQTVKEKTGFVVDIDVDVLIFALDGLSDALSMGVSVSSALEPWSKLAKSFMSDSVVVSLRPVAARALHASIAYVRSVPRHELDDDQKKEEISDCLRDVVSVVPIADILDDFNARFSAELHAGDWKMINARLYVLLALVKSFHSCAQSSFECLIEQLRVLLTHDEHVPKSSQASACWVLAGLSGYMSSILPHATLLRVAHTLILGMRHREHTVARGASVAMMRLSEQSAAVSAFSSTDVPSLLAGLHATGGPTPTPTLELGQERESTILLRSLTFYTVCGTREATERACSMLAEPVIEALNACLIDATSSDAYVQRLVDLDIVLRSIKRACEHTAGEASATVAHLVFSAAASIERMTVALIDPKLVEQRFKMSWAMKALVELIEFVDGLAEVVARICVEAFSRCGSPELGTCYLDPLSLACELYGDRAFDVSIQGITFHSLGHVVAELLARTLPAAMHEPDCWMSVFSLCRAAVRNGFIALCPHVELLVRVSRESLRGVSDEAAVAALSLCMDLLRSPIMLDANAASTATIQISQSAMNAGMGRIAAEVSGEATRKRGVCPWNNSDARSQSLAKAFAVSMEQGSAALLIRGLLEGGNGAMPPSMISDIAASLHLVWSTFGTESFRRVLATSLGGEDDAFPRAKSTLEEKSQWVEILIGDTARSDCRIFKRLLKAFLSGKKVGAN